MYEVSIYRAMSKITLDRETFKVLASETRLEILKALDGRRVGLSELTEGSHLTKATLHEHLAKLSEAGLIKRTSNEKQKQVSYKLSWKATSLLHPENTRIVVLFTSTLVALGFGIFQLVRHIMGLGISPVSDGTLNTYDSGPQMLEKSSEVLVASQDPVGLYLTVGCFLAFTVLLCVVVWRLRVNRTSKL